MPTDPIVATSKLLSYVLRHGPDSIGLILDLIVDDQGWADVGELLARLQANGHSVDRVLLDRVVADNDKQRFAFDAGRTCLRASQGHSIAVDLALPLRTPPPVQYHGTATRFVASIQSSGLRPGARRHVHLSGDVQTAIEVGTRYGVPVVLCVDAARMHADGLPLYRADNGVWLSDAVAPRYLSRLAAIPPRT